MLYFEQFSVGRALDKKSKVAKPGSTPDAVAWCPYEWPWERT